MKEYDSFIDDSIVIDFEVPPAIQELIDIVEDADKNNNYGILVNYTDAIEYNTKDYVMLNILTMEQRERLMKKYCYRWWSS